ncbi:MAG: HRDC domain-containing protein, partial [Deltaproteobacteria bacterium]|nr:HRDC domain-containing protein [Deltaproteobacteria bacterium]
CSSGMMPPAKNGISTGRSAKSKAFPGRKFVSSAPARFLKFRSRGISTDEAVLSFVAAARGNPPSHSGLRAAKVAYQQQLLLECFDFKSLRHRLQFLVRLLKGNEGLVEVSGVSDMGRLQEMAERDIFSVGEKFKRQLRTLFKQEVLPESDAHILDRIGKASNWFQNKFSLILRDVVQNLRAETDNRELGKQIGNALNYFKQETVAKLAGIESCENEFSPSQYLHALSNAEIDFSPEKERKSQVPDYGESDMEHAELFHQLKQWRSRKAKEQNVAHFQILHQRVLIQIAISLPDNGMDLEKIKGVGKKTLEKYGEELLEMVMTYRKKHGIKRVLLPEVKSVAAGKNR